MNQIKTGSFIAERRKAMGLTQEQLGELLLVTNKTVSRWETGKYMPDIDKLQELAAVLGVSVDELLSGELEPSGSRVPSAAARKVSPFSPAEKLAYYKKKWLRDNRSYIILLCLLFPALFGALLYRFGAAAAALSPLAALAVYLFMRHRMMVYAEGKSFPAEG